MLCSFPRALSCHTAPILCFCMLQDFRCWHFLVCSVCWPHRFVSFRFLTNKVICLTYCLHVLRSFPRAFILPHCDDSQLAFFCLDCTCKTCPWSPIFVSFPLVFLSPRANTHHCPHINLCAPIRNCPYLICFFVCKT